jgi:hypothetical protein
LACLGGELVDVHERVAAVLAELAERQCRVTGSHCCQRGIGAGAVAEHGQAAGDHKIGVQIAGYLDGILHVGSRPALRITVADWLIREAIMSMMPLLRNVRSFSE